MLPDAGTQVTVGVESQASVAVVLNVTTPLLAAHVVVMSAGHVIVGDVVSRTVTVNEQLREFGGVA